jgi:serine protease Do
MLELDTTEGLLVIGVDSGSPAARAGLRPYDVLLAIDGQRVRDPASATALLRTFRPGETVRMTILRDGQRLEATMTLTG